MTVLHTHFYKADDFNLTLPYHFFKKKHASSTEYYKNKCMDYTQFCFKISHKMNTRFTKSLIHYMVSQKGIHLMPSETVSCQWREFYVFLGACYTV